MRTRGRTRPERSSVHKGDGRVLLDHLPAHVGLWINAQIGGNGTIVETNTAAPMGVQVPGTVADGQWRFYVWYKGTIYGNDWPAPSPSAYVWGEGIIAQLHVDTGYIWQAAASASAEVKRLIVKNVSVAEWCSWADANILGMGTPSDLRPPPGTLASRLANCPKLLAALTNKTPVKVCMMGDSYQALTNAYPAPLLRRSYPGMTVQFTNYSLGSHGAEQWVAEGQTVINNALQPLAPDVVAFGGISSLWVDNAAWLTLVDMIRVALPSCEIILASDARGTRSTPTSSIVSTTAAAKGTAFFDAATTLDNWASDSGFNTALWISDGVHYGMRGGLVCGRGWAWFLGAHV
jgi:hypothetical protein